MLKLSKDQISSIIYCLEMYMGCLDERPKGHEAQLVKDVEVILEILNKEHLSS